MLLQTALFRSCFWLSSILLCVYTHHILFILPSVGRCCFQRLHVLSPMLLCQTVGWRWLGGIADCLLLLRLPFTLPTRLVPPPPSQAPLSQLTPHWWNGPGSRLCWSPQCLGISIWTLLLLFCLQSIVKFWGSTQCWCDSCAFGGSPRSGPQTSFGSLPFFWGLSISGGQTGWAAELSHLCHPLLPTPKTLPCRSSHVSVYLSLWLRLLVLQINIRFY